MADNLDMIQRLLVTMFREEGTEARQNTLYRIFNESHPAFASQACLYAKYRLGLKTASHSIAARLADKTFIGKENFFFSIVDTPEDMTEIASLVESKIFGGKGKLPNAVKRAFAKKLSMFSYDVLSDGVSLHKTVNLYDLIHICHPKNTPALNKFMTKELRDGHR